MRDRLRRRRRGALPRTTLAGAALCLVVSALGLASSSVAQADGGATCPLGSSWCVVTGAGGGHEGSGGTGTGGSRTETCAYLGATVPCYIDGEGQLNESTGCYEEIVAAQLPPDAPIWHGRDSSAGTWWQETCGGQSPTDVFIPIAGSGGTPRDAAVAALARIRLEGPAIRMVPAPGSRGGLVGLPVWMWTTVAPHTWGPISSTASTGGLTVRITATATRIDWDMGDGTTVTCTGPGMPYVALDGDRPSPDCGHVYLRPSSALPGGVYPVTATTTWRVAWSGGGDSGVIVTARQSTAAVRIAEQQVVVW